MEKHILRWSYWLGVVCAVLAIVMRLSNALGFEFVHVPTKGNWIDFHSLLDAALLFLFIAIASSGYAGSKSQQHKP